MYDRTYPNLLVFRASRQELAIGTEANTTDVEVTVLVDILVLQRRHILTSGHVEDLG